VLGDCEKQFSLTRALLQKHVPNINNIISRRPDVSASDLSSEPNSQLTKNNKGEKNEHKSSKNNPLRYHGGLRFNGGNRPDNNLKSNGLE
jgi:hypothetical protein